MSGLGTLGANLIDNLPAYLALEPAAADSPLRLAALLVGVNAGPVITPWASLATLLWAARCRSAGVTRVVAPVCLAGRPARAPGGRGGGHRTVAGARLRPNASIASGQPTAGPDRTDPRHAGISGQAQGQALGGPSDPSGRTLHQSARLAVRGRDHLLLGPGHGAAPAARVLDPRLRADRPVPGGHRRRHGGCHRCAGWHVDPETQAKHQRPDHRLPAELERRRNRRPGDGALLRRRLDGQPEERRAGPVATGLRPAGSAGQHRQEDRRQPAVTPRPDRADRDHLRAGVRVDGAHRHGARRARAERHRLAPAGPAFRADRLLDRRGLAAVHVPVHGAPRGA